jgi:hypothetical protein
MKQINILFLALALTIGCGEPDSVLSEMNNESLLNQTWFESYEETQDGIRVYRTPAYPFPPSREGMKFKENRILVELKIAPACGIEEVEGEWGFVNKNVVEIVSSRDGTYKVKILSVSNDVLRIQKLVE